MIRTQRQTGRVRRSTSVVAALAGALASVAGVALTAAPASAASCSSASGVSVVVDFTTAPGATGGVQSVCVPNGGGTPADEVITAAGFPLTWPSRQPGFICRVKGVPASDPCVNTPPDDAYWGLFWSDGKNGAWTYSEFGVTALEVPDGGYIGLAWQSGTRRVPAQAPTAHQAPAPTSSPEASAGAPTAASTSPGATSSTSPTTKQTTNPSSTQVPTAQGPTPSTAPDRSGPADARGGADPMAGATHDPSAADAAAGSPRRARGGPDKATDRSARTARDEASKAPGATDGPTMPDQPEPGESTLGDAQLASEPASGRVPTWLSVGILLMLLLAIGLTTVAARRRTRA